MLLQHSHMHAPKTGKPPESKAYSMYRQRFGVGPNHQIKRIPLEPDEMVLAWIKGQNSCYHIAQKYRTGARRP